jgi:hypothetical protein
METNTHVKLNSRRSRSINNLKIEDPVLFSLALEQEICPDDVADIVAFCID